MSKKKIDRAEEVSFNYQRELGMIDSVSDDHIVARRMGFKDGYELAEKDLALTIEDMERIHTFLYAIKNNKSGQLTFTRLSDEQYEEALRRFNKWRDKE